MRLMTSLNHDELAGLCTSVVVEMWDKKNYGRARRAWLAEFNEAERERAGKLYAEFCDWYLRKGIPESRTMSFETLHFIQRLVNFFGSI